MSIRTRFSQSLPWLAYALLVWPAILRACVSISPNPSFALDPLHLPMPTDGIGPAGSLTLDALMMAGAWLALVVEWRSGRGVRWSYVALAIIPVVATVWHVVSSPEPMAELGVLTTLRETSVEFEGVGQSIRHPENLVMGSAWTAAILAAVGAAHLARNLRVRIALVASVVGLTIPLACKGIYQVVIEHPMTVQEFEASKDAIFAAHGWAPDSPQARLYERRLVQPEATGWFALANVFGSLMAAFFIFWVSLAIAAARSRMAGGWIGVLGLFAAAAGTGLALTRSKGAIAVALLGLIIAFAVLLPKPSRQALIRAARWIGPVCIAIVLLAVIARGAIIGDRSAADGYSLLFRWHYWIGAGRAFLHEPIFGVGPDTFKAAYLVLKPPINPEDVSDPHSVFITWIATLGVFGLAWTALTLALLRHSAPRLRRIDPDQVVATPAKSDPGRESDDEHGFDRTSLLISMMPGLLALFASAWLNRTSSYPDFQFVLWPLAMVCFALVHAALPRVGLDASWALVRWAGWAALLVLLVHSQIEMTMTRIGSVGIALLLLGGCGTLASGRTHLAPQSANSWLDRLRSAFFAVPAFTILLAALASFIWLAIGPVVRAERMLHRAAAHLSVVGEARQIAAGVGASASVNDPTGMLSALQEAGDVLNREGITVSLDGRVREAAAAIRANDRDRVGAIIQSAWDDVQNGIERLQMLRITDPIVKESLKDVQAHLPYDDVAWRQSALLHLMQARHYHAGDDVAGRVEAYNEAVAHADHLTLLRPDRAGAWARAASLYEEWGMISGRRDVLLAARERLEMATKLDPNSLDFAGRMAALLESLEMPEESNEWYRRVLELNDLLRLDPLKQLTDSERERIEKRLQAGGP